MSEFDLNSVMQQAQMLQEKVKYMQKGLETEKVEGTAGAGMVKATVTGTQKIVAIHIDPSVLEAPEQKPTITLRGLGALPARWA